MSKLHTSASACTNDILAHTPVIFLANKQDLPSSKPPNEVIAEIVGGGSTGVPLMRIEGIPPVLGISALTS
jgi:hypothetical protein